MAIDIRATVTCSLGTLISAQISDDYVQGTGLIKYKGSAELSGVFTPQIGETVTFTYNKGSGTQTVPRLLRVLSSFADPFRRTTKVELGCKLTYLQDLQEPIDWDAYEDADNKDLTEEDARIVTRPISASSVMRKCLTELGITATSNPLTNRFSIAEYDFSGGYVSVLSELLVSEGYCAYLDQSEQLQLVDMGADGAAAPVIDSQKIIDLGPIGVGQLPGESVIVSYSTLQINNDPNTDEVEKRNWEKDVTEGTPTTVSVPNPTFGVFGSATSTTREFQYEYTPRSEVVSEYDEWDRLVTRTTTNYTILADMAPGYLQHFAGSSRFQLTEGGNEYYTREVTSIEYEIPAVRRKTPPQNYEKVKKETTSRFEPYVKLIASTSLYDLAGSNNVYFSFGLGDTFTFEAERTETTQESAYDSEGALVAKTLTSYSRCLGYTQRGQQMLARAFNGEVVLFEGTLPGAILNPGDSGGLYSNGTAEATLLNAMELIFEGVETRIAVGREINLQKRPSAADRVNDDVGAERVESSAELQLALGSATAQRRIEFTMPKAPDDKFIKSGSTYQSIRSDASAKARRYGRIQNRLLLGNRSGMNIQTAPEDLPSAPFSSIIIQAGGLSGLYKTNGTSYQMSSEGILVSTDALFWGAVGGTGAAASNSSAFWFPVAPGVTFLPPPPETVNGEMVVESVVPVWVETIPVDANLRLALGVQRTDYAALTQTNASVLVKATLTCSASRPIVVPLSVMSCEAPAVYLSGFTGLNISVPVMAVQAEAPSIEMDAVDFIVNVPVADAAVGVSAVALANTYTFNLPISEAAVSAQMPGYLLRNVSPSGIAQDTLPLDAIAVTATAAADLVVELAIEPAAVGATAEAPAVEMIGRYTHIKNLAAKAVQAGAPAVQLDGGFTYLIEPGVVTVGCSALGFSTEQTFSIAAVNAIAASELPELRVSLPEIDINAVDVAGVGKGVAVLDCNASGTDCRLHVGWRNVDVQVLEPVLLLNASDRTTLSNVRATAVVAAQEPALLGGTANSSVFYAPITGVAAEAPAVRFVRGTNTGDEAVPYLVLCNINSLDDGILGVRLTAPDGTIYQLRGTPDFSLDRKDAYVFLPEGKTFSDFSSSTAYNAVNTSLGGGALTYNPVAGSLRGFVPPFNEPVDITIYQAVPDTTDVGVTAITGYLHTTELWNSSLLFFEPGTVYRVTNPTWGKP